VDKDRHYRGSTLWNKNKEIVEKAVGEAVANASLPPDTAIQYEDKEDLNVLYINITADQKTIGVLFMRNSGTEDKNATYVKGEKQYEKVLCEIGKKIQRLHSANMKNESRAEYKYEQAVLRNLYDYNGKTTVDNVLAALDSVSEADLFGVIHGLVKEGRVSVLGRDIEKVY
jgi:hypothetical protein